MAQPYDPTLPAFPPVYASNGYADGYGGYHPQNGGQAATISSGYDPAFDGFEGNADAQTSQFFPFFPFGGPFFPFFPFWGPFFPFRRWWW